MKTKGENELVDAKNTELWMKRLGFKTVADGEVRHRNGLLFALYSGLIGIALVVSEISAIKDLVNGKLPFNPVFFISFMVTGSVFLLFSLYMICVVLFEVVFQKRVNLKD